MADIEWIKFYIGMFDNKKIKYIRALPEGNNILLIWIMLLSMAGKCNSNGYIFLTEKMPYTPEMLAKEFGFELSVINLALMTLEDLNMIQKEHCDIYVCNWCKYQNIDGMEKIKLQNAKRQEKFRNKKKQLLLPSNVTNNVTVTKNNATELDKEKELDKELDKELLQEEVSCGCYQFQLKDVFLTYENEIGLISPTIKETFESYQQDISYELMMLAIKTAVKSNARRLNYVEGILRNWVNDSIHTVEELKAKEIEKHSKPKYVSQQTKIEKFNSMASHDWDFEELEKLQEEHIREKLRREGRLDE